jgi:hypothetical protein
LSVQHREDGSVVLVSDLYELQIDPTRGGTIGSLRSLKSGKEFVDAGSPRRFGEYRGYFIEDRAWYSSADATATIIVEEEGPVRAAVRVNATMGSAQVSTLIQIAVGEPRIDVSVTLHFQQPTWIGDPYEPAPTARMSDPRRSQNDGRWKLQVYLPFVQNGSLFKSAAFDVCRSNVKDTSFQSWDDIKHNIIAQWIDLAQPDEAFGLAVLSDRTTVYNFGPDQPLGLVLGWAWDGSFWWGKIIHIDSTRADMDNFYTPAVEMLGDIAATLSSLEALVRAVVLSPDVERFFTTLGSKRALRVRDANNHDENPIHPLRIVAELQKWLAEDVTLCLDMGSFHLWIAHFLYSFRARQVLISNGQQTLGVALPWGIASCLVRPREKTLSISGDGGFLFSAMELETAVRLKLNLVHMVWIDRTYDMVAVQESAKYKRTSGVELGPVDVVKYAEAFGATGYMINSADEIAPALRKAFEVPGPVLIGIRVDYRDNHILFEKAHEHLSTDSNW